MNISLDTDSKTVTVDEDVNLGIFYDQIKRLLPESWMSFTLKQRYNLGIREPVYVYKHELKHTEVPWEITYGKTNYNTGIYSIKID